MNIGDLVSSLPLKATSNVHTSFDRLRGKWLVLYFYPKDATPGCTTEGCDFRDNDKSFAFLNTVVFGVSRDNLASHEKFKLKQGFPFELISDVDEELCTAFDVIKMKPLYGKQVRGIERSTFIIDPDGYVRHIWRKVKVDGHVNEVLDVLRTLQHD
jgi:peroxiredoxin Q/BCP